MSYEDDRNFHPNGAVNFHFTKSTRPPKKITAEDKLISQRRRVLEDIKFKKENEVYSDALMELDSEGN